MHFLIDRYFDFTQLFSILDTVSVDMVRKQNASCRESWVSHFDSPDHILNNCLTISLKYCYDANKSI